MGLYLYNNLNDMMRKILSFVCAALLVAGLCGCEKIDVNKLEGTWTEQYDPTVFAMDGSVEYTFDGNNGYQLHELVCDIAVVRHRWVNGNGPLVNQVDGIVAAVVVRFAT